jgi:hypothetical protein
LDFFRFNLIHLSGALLGSKPPLWIFMAPVFAFAVLFYRASNLGLLECYGLLVAVCWEAQCVVLGSFVDCGVAAERFDWPSWTGPRSQMIECSY